MASKKLPMFLGILTSMLLALTLVSAVSLDTIDPASITVPSSVLDNAGSFDITFDLTNTGATGTLDWSASTLTQGTGSISFSQDSINASVTDTITATVTFDADQTGNIEGTIDVIGEGASTHENFTFSVSITETEDEFCGDIFNVADLEVDIKDINVEEGLGDDDDYWYPFDQVEIEVDVENKGDWDVEDIEFEFCLYDLDEDECILDEGDVDVTDEEFDLDEDDDEKTILITFTVDPDDLNEGSNDYEIRVKATGTIDDNDAGTLDGEETCTSDSADIEIRTNEEFFIIGNIVITDVTEPNEDNMASCGSEVLLTADVWNIGDSKIDSDEIFVRVYNRDLGLDEVIDMDDISSLDSEELNVRFTIPEDTDSKYYGIEVSVYDDEDMRDKDIYENSEDDEAVYNEFIQVICGPSEPQVTIDANLISDAMIGEDLVVQVSVTNDGETGSFLINPTSYEAWASLVDVSPAIVPISEGTTEQSLVTFNPTTAGAQTFKIQVNYNGQVVEKTVSVNIAEKTGLLTGAFSGLGNTTLLVIAAVFLILIVAVIILIVKVAGSKPAEF